MDTHVLAYLAGAMDSDGYFSIRRSTYAMRVRKDASQPVFSERIGLKQVTLAIPQLLYDTFGGQLRLDKPSSIDNGKPLWGFQCTDLKAATAVRALLPFLRIKHEQAKCLLALQFPPVKPLVSDLGI